MWCTRLEVEAFDDPAVVKASRGYHWVCVDRDITPDVPKRLNVSAYPSLLVLGPAEENVHRFQGFAKKDEFVGRLLEGLRRHALFRDGETWDTPNPRPTALTDSAAVTTLRAPSEDVPAGITSLGDDLLVAQIGSLRRLDPRTGEVRGTFEIDRSTMDIATDGKVLYAVPSGWTAGHPIRVLDPTTGAVKREIVTEANKTNRSHGAKGITWHRGRLLVLEGMHGRIHHVDVQTGEVTRTTQSTERWISGLATDGTHLLTVSRGYILRLDPTTGETVSKIPVNYRLRSVGLHRGGVYVMEQPVFGHGREHERIQIWPAKGETKIYRIGE